MAGLLACVFPGQGSQRVGMLSAMAEAEPVVRETFAEASGVLGYDLWNLAQSGPQEALNLTERTQPLILCASVALWRVACRGGAMPRTGRTAWRVQCWCAGRRRGCGWCATAAPTWWRPCPWAGRDGCGARAR
jgi:hypothetical protein